MACRKLPYQPIDGIQIAQTTDANKAHFEQYPSMHGLTHSRNRLIQDLHGRHGVQRPEPSGDRHQTIEIPGQLAKEQFLSSPVRKHHHVPENTEQLLSQLPGIYSRLQGTVDFGQRLPDITINDAVKNLNQTASIRRPL